MQTTILSLQQKFSLGSSHQENLTTSVGHPSVCSKAKALFCLHSVFLFAKPCPCLRAELTRAGILGSSHSTALALNDPVFAASFQPGFSCRALAWWHLAVPRRAASHQHQWKAALWRLSCDTETPKKKPQRKKKRRISSSSGMEIKLVKGLDVFSFALRLENSRKSLLEEKAHGHQYDLCRLCCLEVSLETEFCGG